MKHFHLLRKRARTTTFAAGSLACHDTRLCQKRRNHPLLEMLANAQPLRDTQQERHKNGSLDVNGRTTMRLQKHGYTDIHSPNQYRGLTLFLLFTMWRCIQYNFFGCFWYRETSIFSTFALEKFLHRYYRYTFLKLGGMQWEEVRKTSMLLPFIMLNNERVIGI